MKLLGIVINMLSAKAKIDVGTKAGAEFLRNDIEARTGEALSLNTVKRLVGILPYDSSPREVTLDIIARYLGYKNWSLLNSDIQNKISDFNDNPDFIDLQKYPPNTKIILKWQPDRTLHLVRQEAGEYLVEKSENSKLLKGDILSLSQIAVGFPLMVRQVWRDGKSLGNYIGAQIEGITSIETINGQQL